MMGETGGRRVVRIFHQCALPSDKAFDASKEPRRDILFLLRLLYVLHMDGPCTASTVNPAETKLIGAESPASNDQFVPLSWSS